MAAASGFRRVEIGFDHSVVPVRLEDAVYEALVKALSDGGERWHVLESEDSKITLDLSKVVFVRLDTERDRVGF